MATLREQERATYETMWDVDAYASWAPGETYVPAFLDMTQTTMRTSVLDAGCGSGKGALALAAEGFSAISLCDLTPDGLLPEARRFPFHQVCLWDDLKATVGFQDWVYCCDVLEHIPPPFTMLVVSRLLEVARRGLFLSINLQPDAYGVWIGTPLHLSIQPYVAWQQQLAELAPIQESRDFLHTGVYLLKTD